MPENNITVSVIMITYNHEKYIQEAIYGVLNQIGNYKLELIVSNDKSSDQTDLKINEIINQYQGDHTIKYFSQPKNLGMRNNFLFALEQAKGKYIALCEGDDKWIDKTKIQIQIAELENDKTLSGIFHQTNILSKNERSNFTKNNYPEVTSIEHHLKHWSIATCSLLFYNFLIDDKYQDIAKNYKSNEFFLSDRPLIAFICKIGNIKYLPQTMATYRRHESNITLIGNQIQMTKESALAYKGIIPLFPENFKLIQEQIVRGYLLAAEASKKSGKTILAFNFVLKSFFNIRSFLAFKEFIVSSIKLMRNKKIYS